MECGTGVEQEGQQKGQGLQQQQQQQQHPPYLPRIVAFDLDACSWETEMYLTSGPPFRYVEKHRHVVDRAGEVVAMFEDTHDVLHELCTHDQWQHAEVAFVSRTFYPEYAHECLNLLPVGNDGETMASVATHFEIYPGCKIDHFKQIHKRTGIPFEEMMFFDNESRNIRDVSRLGVTCVYTPEGFRRHYFDKGLKEFREKKNLGSSSDEGEQMQNQTRKQKKPIHGRGRRNKK